MFAVVVKVELPEGGTIETGRAMLESEVIPRVKQMPGVVAGYWLSPPTGRDGLSVIVFQDEETARGAASSIRTPPGVRLVDVEVREVAASI